MKDRFRVRFRGSGWAIEHTRWLFWKPCGGVVYGNKEYAEKLCAEVIEGKAPSSWFVDKPCSP